MKKVRCYVTRNLTHTAPVEVPPWELQILVAIHGKEKVKVLGQVEVDCEVPYLDAEVDRLTKRFGVVEESGVPWFNQVYGHEERGARALADEIERATGVHPEDRPESELISEFEKFDDVTAKKPKRTGASAA